jgi:stage II sporulation protein P
MIDKRKLFDILKKMSYAIATLLIVGLSMFTFIAKNPTQLFLYEVLPFYSHQKLFQFAFNTEGLDSFNDMEPVFKVSRNIVGLENVTYMYQYKTDNANKAATIQTKSLTEEDIERLRDLDYLRSNFYMVDSRTRMTEEQFNVDNFLSKDMRIDNSSNEPKVLIMHAHPAEMFVDSKDITEGVTAVGSELARILEEYYGIKSIHNTDRHDMVDGQSHLLGAYERMEETMIEILEENPSIEIVLDIHRDGVPEGVRLVTDINGKPTANIMFVNGLSKLYRDGQLNTLYHLPNNYIDGNLAFSFQMQLMANKMYPGLMRRIYLNAFRYSLHMRPKSLLIEVGAQTNTLQEALNAMHPLAEILAAVILD